MNRRALISLIATAPIAAFADSTAAAVADSAPSSVTFIDALPCAPGDRRTVLVHINCGDAKEFQHFQSEQFKAAIRRMIEQARNCL